MQCDLLGKGQGGVEVSGRAKMSALAGSFREQQSTTTTVDGRNPAPVEVVDIPVFIGFFIHPRWLFGISEPSTVLQFFLNLLRIR